MTVLTMHMGVAAALRFISTSRIIQSALLSYSVLPADVCEHDWRCRAHCTDPKVFVLFDATNSETETSFVASNAVQLHNKTITLV